jgi:fluoride ion exporter CrcB/FEX
LDHGNWGWRDWLLPQVHWNTGLLLLLHPRVAVYNQRSFRLSHIGVLLLNMSGTFFMAVLGFVVLLFFRLELSPLGVAKALLNTVSTSSPYQLERVDLLGDGPRLGLIAQAGL